MSIGYSVRRSIKHGRRRRFVTGSRCTITSPSRLDLPVQVQSGRLARSFVTTHWCSPHGGLLLERTHLLVSELVVNAVRHGAGPIVLRIRCTGAGGVVVSVSDGGADLPVHRQVEPSAGGGRGMHLVSDLSAEWGVQRHADPSLPGSAGRGSAGPGSDEPDEGRSGRREAAPGVGGHSHPAQGHYVSTPSSATSSSQGRSNAVRLGETATWGKTVWCRLTS
jgi:anti-sigma regulatory factor (Ser/Thr protein kinase)